MFMNLCFLSVLMTLAGNGENTLVVYPEYPACIERDYAYGVSVTQGDVTRPLVVYNHCEKSNLTGRIHGGDVNRRFCEFAFHGEPVRVDIQVREDVSCYKIFPASRRLKQTFQDGVISVWLDRPMCFGIQLNDDNNTILSVLADEPEDPAAVPDPADPGVLYVERWLDAPGRDGNLVTDDSIREIYIAPGAVLNARLKIHGKGTLVHGRGIILDPMSDIFRFDQTLNTELGFLVTCAPDIIVRDVKLVDARTFNYISRSNSRFYNVKAFSSMMCSDGITFSGWDTFVDGAWLYVGDNALVLSGANGMVVRNAVLGTSCKAIFPQGTFTEVPAVLENIDVFRADEGLVQNVYNGTKDPKKPQAAAVRLKNVCAVDCTLFPLIFAGFDMGELPKSLRFENCSVPESTGAPLYASIGKLGPAICVRNSEKWLHTSNYTLDFVNLYVAGRLVTDMPEARLVGKENMTLTFQTSETADQLPLRPDRHEVSYIYPYKVYVGDSLQRRPVPPKPGEFAEFYDREKGAFRFPYESNDENFLADTLKTRSVWQRVPSWKVKLETRFEEDGNVIYRLSKIQEGAGMQCHVTDGLLRAGNGKYVLTFDAKSDSSAPTPLHAVLLSNEKTLRQPVEVTRDWKTYTVEFVTDFVPEETELVSLILQFQTPLGVAEFRNLSLKKSRISCEILNKSGFAIILGNPALLKIAHEVQRGWK